MENVLRWVATCLLVIITLAFVHLGLSVMSGQANDLFFAFLNTTWPLGAPDTSTIAETDTREQLAFSIINYGITALGTAWVACFAYLMVMQNQHRQASQQLSLERLQLTSDLDEKILEIFDSEAVFEIDDQGSQRRTKFLSACDRNTVWRDGTDREWNYRDGERTIAFVESSTSVSSDAEIGLTALHRYLAWIRHIVRAIETHVLLDKDVLLFWRWVVIGCYRNRYPFLCAIFFKDDLKDFVRLTEKIILTSEKLDAGQDFAVYLKTVGDPQLISELSEDAQKIVARSETSANLNAAKSK